MKNLIKTCIQKALINPSKIPIDFHLCSGTRTLKNFKIRIVFGYLSTNSGEPEVNRNLYILETKSQNPAGTLI